MHCLWTVLALLQMHSTSNSRSMMNLPLFMVRCNLLTLSALAAALRNSAAAAATLQHASAVMVASVTSCCRHLLITDSLLSHDAADLHTGTPTDKLVSKQYDSTATLLVVKEAQ